MLVTATGLVVVPHSSCHSSGEISQLVHQHTAARERGELHMAAELRVRIAERADSKVAGAPQ